MLAVRKSSSVGKTDKLLSGSQEFGFSLGGLLEIKTPTKFGLIGLGGYARRIKS